MTTRVNFPAELYAEILEHTDDQRTLLSLVYTSRLVRGEATRQLYKDVKLYSLDSLAALARSVAQTPAICHHTRSFDIQVPNHVDPQSRLSENGKQTSLKAILSQMHSLVKLTVNMGVSGTTWDKIKSSLASSGAKLQEFRCWQPKYDTMSQCQPFLESQPSISTLFLLPSPGESEVISDSMLPNLTTFSGYHTAINPFFPNRPIQRLQLLSPPADPYSAGTNLPQLMALHLNIRFNFFIHTPTISFLECPCYPYMVSTAPEGLSELG